MNNTRISIRQGNMYFFINANDIVRIEASESNALIYLKEGEHYKVTKSLKKIEELLPQFFYKIHRSHIVNKNYISSIIDSNNLEMNLKDNSVVPISKNKKSFLLKRYKRL